MNRKVTAALLIAAAVLTNLAFTVLGTVFNYPDVLKEPIEDILAKSRASQTALMTWFAVLALSAALFAPIAVGVGRLSTTHNVNLFPSLLLVGAITVPMSVLVLAYQERPGFQCQPGPLCSPPLSEG